MSRELKSHYTLPYDFVDRALKISESDPLKDGEIGYLTRVLTLAGLPHTDPGMDKSVWVRKNGKFRMIINAGREIDQEGNEVNIGLPFGIYPRLLLVHICRQVVLTGERKVLLGDSLSSFMRELSLSVGGGKTGSIGRFKDQMNRLFRANLSYTFNEQRGDFKGEGIAHRPVASEVMLWWHAKDHSQGALFNSYIELGEKFYEEILTHPVPIHMEVIRLFKKSPLALDIYCWLTYRVMGLKKTQFIPWKALMSQFGSDYSDTKNFKKMTWRYMQQIQLSWEGLKIEKQDGGFCLNPAPTHISKKGRIFA